MTLCLKAYIPKPVKQRTITLYAALPVIKIIHFELARTYFAEENRSPIFVQFTTFQNEAR